MNIRTSIFAAGAFVLTSAAQAAEVQEPGFALTLGLHEIYDENIYRLPDDVDPASSDPGVSRSDYVSRASLGIGQMWQWSQQKVLIDLNANHNAYRYNDYLDNTSGVARAAWQWQAGRLTGEFAGDYQQSLASFANTRFLGRDLIETEGASIKLGFRLGPQWSLQATGRHADTEHSADSRRFDNSGNDSTAFGLQFKTSSENEFALSYRFNRTDFEYDRSLDGSPLDRNFEERGGNFRMHYAWSEKTAFDANAGYLEREYSNLQLNSVARGSFSGGLWDAALEWQPTIKISLTFSGWRKLAAYLDSESDYFVSEGGSILTSWKPTDRFGISLEAGYETQDFLSSTVNPLVGEGRQDRVSSERVTLSYRALRRLRFELAGRIEDRESNRDALQFDTLVASFGIRWDY